MSERDGFEPGVPCWVAGVHPDPAAAARFYAELFGWEAEDLMPAGSSESYTVCRLRGRDVAALVSPGPTRAPPPGPPRRRAGPPPPPPGSTRADLGQARVGRERRRGNGGGARCRGHGG